MAAGTVNNRKARSSRTIFWNSQRFCPAESGKNTTLVRNRHGTKFKRLTSSQNKGLLWKRKIILCVMPIWPHNPSITGIFPRPWLCFIQIPCITDKVNIVKMAKCLFVRGEKKLKSGKGTRMNMVSRQKGRHFLRRRPEFSSLFRNKWPGRQVGPGRALCKLAWKATKSFSGLNSLPYWWTKRRISGAPAFGRARFWT